MILSIDIETYCDLDLGDCGVYKYASHPSFEVLLFAYAFDDDPVQVLDLSGRKPLPRSLWNALSDPQIIKTAFNANFERICLSAHVFGGRHPLYLKPEQWDCTMVRAGVAGYPMSLEAAGKALQIDKEKLESGSALIRYFSKPCKATKTNGKRTRNLPEHDPEKWEMFKEYCKRDVEAEREIKTRLNYISISDEERKLYALDQHIVDRGVLIDKDLVTNAISIDNQLRKELEKEAIELTGLENPNSPAQLKIWLKEETGIAFPSLAKGVVQELLDSGKMTTKAEKILKIRQLMSKTSVKKYAKMESAACSDDRVRGLIQFYGANRTGRWAGRLVQVQNLPQNKIEDLDLARDLILANDYDAFEMVFENPAAILSQLIRTAFIAPKGKTFVVSDFSAIEARVIAWLADEQWRLEVFSTHGKIYEASAAKMLGKEVEEVTKAERSKGKVAELALGYQGGKGALLAMGALNMGLEEDELTGIVDSWRQSNPAIVRLWHNVQKAAINAIQGRGRQMVNGKVFIETREGSLAITLPSGRSLYYVKAGIGLNRFGGESITYMGMDQTTKKWVKLETYGGKLVENIVQAIARDCLANTLLNLDNKEAFTVMHIHDEVVVEVEENIAEKELERINKKMTSPNWAPDLPLKGDGYITRYYKKD